MIIIWRLKAGVAVEVFLFGQGDSRNNLSSAYFGTYKAEDGFKRVVEWDLAGKCTYASEWFSPRVDPMTFEWNNIGPMRIDSFVNLENFDFLLATESEEKPLRRITNPIFSLELE